MKVGFIGFGNMAQALAAGLAASGALQPGQIGACARDRAKLHRNTEPHGFLAFDDAAGVAGFADVVVVAVKPYQVEAVDRKSTRLNSSHYQQSRMPSSA